MRACDERDAAPEACELNASAACSDPRFTFELTASAETSQLLDDLHEAIAAAEGHPELEPALVALRRVWRSLQVIAAEVQQ